MSTMNKIKKQCSRTLPKPIRLFRHRGDRHKLMYVLYPDLSRFKRACKNCKFRNVIKTEAGRKSQCRLEDKDFKLKFYGIAPQSGVKTLCDTAPSHIKKQYPELYEDVVSYFEGHRARSLERGVLQSGRQAGQGKPHLTNGKTFCLQEKKQPDRSEGLEKPLKQ